MSKQESKIITLKTKSDDVVEFLEQAIAHVKERKIDNVMVVMKLRADDEGNVLAGYCNLNVAEKQELVGHIQVDIMRDYIERNFR